MASLLANMMAVGGVNHAACVVRLLEFQGNLSGWGEVLVRLPPPRRMVLLQWGKAPELLPLVAKAFSPRWQQRANAAHPLAKIAGANADWILEQLLRDPQRLVYIRALDAVWRRKPTPAMIQTLWFHALVFLGISVNFPPAPPRKAMFCGQTITVGPDADCVSAPNGLAMETLVHWNPPGITRLTINALAKIGRMSAAQDPFNWPYDIRAKDLAKLILLAKPVMVEPYLLYMANRPSRQAVSFTSNHQPRYFSNHTMPLYLLVKLAHQNPSAFHLYHTRMDGGTWSGGTARQENAAIKKITAWYAKHGIEPVTKVQLKKMKMPPIGAFRRP